MADNDDVNGGYDEAKIYYQNIPELIPSGSVRWLYLADDGLNPFLGLRDPDGDVDAVDLYTRLYKTSVPPGTPFMAPTEVLFSTMRIISDSMGNTRIEGSIASPTSTPSNTFYINGLLITITGPTLTNVISDINGSEIPNITATSDSNHLVINSNSDIILADGIGSPLVTLGLSAGITPATPIVSIVDINQPDPPLTPLNPVPVIPTTPTPTFVPSITPFFVIRSRQSYGASQYFIHLCFEFIIPQNYESNGQTKLFVNCGYSGSGTFDFAPLNVINYVTVAIYKDNSDGTVTDNLISEQAQPLNGVSTRYTFNVGDGGLVAGNRLYINLYQAMDNYLGGTVHYIQTNSIIFSNS